MEGWLHVFNSRKCQVAKIGWCFPELRILKSRASHQFENVLGDTIAEAVPQFLRATHPAACSL